MYCARPLITNANTHCDYMQIYHQRDRFNVRKYLHKNYILKAFIVY